MTPTEGDIKHWICWRYWLQKHYSACKNVYWSGNSLLV